MVPLEIQAVHSESYERFCGERLKSLIANFFASITSRLPEESVVKSIRLIDIKLKERGYDVAFCRERNLTYADDVIVECEIESCDTAKASKRSICLENAFIHGLPKMTDNEFFVIKGKDLYFILQLLPSPGMFFYRRDTVLDCLIVPQSGYRITFTSSPSWRDKRLRGVDFKVQIQGKQGKKGRGSINLSLEELLYALGATKEEIALPDALKPLIIPGSNDIFCFPEEIAESALKDVFELSQKTESRRQREERIAAINKVHRYLFDEKVEEEKIDEAIIRIRKELIESSELGKIGRWQVNRRLQRLDERIRPKGIPNLEYDSDDYLQKEVHTKLTLDDVIGAIQYFSGLLGKEISELDDPEHIDNFMAVRVGDYLENRISRRLEKIANVLKGKPRKGKAITPEYIEKFLGERLKLNIVAEMLGSRCCRYLLHTNALADAVEKRRITKVIPGGIRKGSREFYDPIKRDMHWSYYGRLCPVDTPQNQSIGFVLSLTNVVKIDVMGRMLAPYRLVNDGKVMSEEPIYLTASEEEQIWIAYGDQVEEYNGKHRLKSGTILARRGAQEIQRVSPADIKDIKYIDYLPEQPLGLAACLIPFVRYNEPNRALMACGAMRQALPLKYPQAPLVKTGWEEKAVQESYQPLYAEASGIVVGHSAGAISVKYDDDLKRYNLYNSQGNMAKSLIEQRSVVRDGQKVAEDVLLADCSTSQNGCLALGKNVLVAFMPWFGWNFEDAIVVSGELQKEFTSLHAYEHEYVVTKAMFQADEERMRNVIRNRAITVLGEEYQEREREKGAKTAQNWFNKIVHDEYENRELEYELLLKDGDTIEAETPFVQVVYRIKKQSKRSERIGVPDSIKIPKLDSKQPVGIYGKVCRVRVYNNREELPLDVRCIFIFRFTILYERPLELGDKLAGRHGNKGVVSKILPEEAMPFFYDEQGTHERHGNIKGKHTHVDVILNPMGVPSRQNLGQLFETSLGWVIRRKGEDGRIIPLSSDITVEKLQGELKAIADAAVDEKGKANMWYTEFKDEKQGKPKAIETPATVGDMYLMKLNHNAADKINVRGQGGYTQVTEQPLKGRRLKGGQRLGEMEVWALLAHNVRNLLSEMLGCKSDEIVGRNEFLKMLEEEEDIRDVSLASNFAPESLKVLTFFLRALGLSVKFYDADNADITTKLLAKESSPMEVGNVSIEIASPDEIKEWSDNAPPLKTAGQLDDKDNFSQSDFGWQMGYIDLMQTPVVNPLFKEIVEDLASFFKSVDSQTLRDIAPRYAESSVAYLTSDPDKQERLLRAVKLDRLIQTLQFKPKRRRKMSRLLERCCWLQEHYKATNLEPLLMKVLPVLPPKYRPRRRLENGKIAELHLSGFYKDILSAVQSAQDAPADKFVKNWKNIVERVEKLFGILWAFDRRGQKRQSLYDFLHGKKGLPRRVLLGKRCDYSARAVITVNPKLSINECILPAKIARQMYQHIFPLVDRRSAGNISQDPQEMAQMFFSFFVADQPILLNRNPTLHRMGIMAFRPLLNVDKDAENVIAINPLVTAPFGADFDGDQMAAFVPMLAASKEDAQQMLASKHIFSPANGELVANLSQEIMLGLYLLSTKFKNGRERLEKLLGDKLPDSTNGLTGAELQQLLKRKELTEEFVECLDKLKEEGFTVATRYGCTYSLFDIPDDATNWENRLKESNENPLAWIYFSGARGNEKQMRYMMGTIGDGIDSIGYPKKELLQSNFRNGLSIGEYYYVGYESRKTQVDKQLITPRAGWLTRKLVFATQHLRIVTDECSPSDYLFVRKEYLSGERVFDLLGRWYRVRNSDAEEELTGQKLQAILSDEQCEGIFIRSPLFCQAEGGLCQKCYGIDLSTRGLVEISTPVGIIASQSIGERTTQLSLSAPHKAESKSPVEELVGILESKTDLNAPCELLVKLQGLLSKVNLKHFEVILRAMLEEQEGKRRIIGVERTIRKRGWLARLGFNKPFFALQESALKKERDELRDLLSSVMIGNYQSQSNTEEEE